MLQFFVKLDDFSHGNPSKNILKPLSVNKMGKYFMCLIYYAF
jgi:hypothetical protein